MKKKVIPKLRQEVKVKVDIVTSDHQNLLHWEIPGFRCKVYNKVASFKT